MLVHRGRPGARRTNAGSDQHRAARSAGRPTQGRGLRAPQSHRAVIPDRSSPPLPKGLPLCRSSIGRQPVSTKKVAELGEPRHEACVEDGRCRRVRTRPVPSSGARAVRRGQGPSRTEAGWPAPERGAFHLAYPSKPTIPRTRRSMSRRRLANRTGRRG